MSFRDWPILRQLGPNFLSSVRLAFVFGQTGSEALMVSGDDKVYGVGKNISFSLGVGDIDTTLPCLNQVLCDKNVDGFTYGGNANNSIFIIAHLQNGAIYQWGSLPPQSYNISEIPQRVDFNLQVKAVACGLSHCIILSDDGRVFTWGENYEGQLGHFHDEKAFHQYDYEYAGTYEPVEVKGAIEGKVVTDISCGAKFSVVVTEGGRVFTWGSNKDGQLGINNKDTVKFGPVAVSLPDNVVIEKIACGRSHVLALCKNCELYAWGSNKCSQLGVPALKKGSCYGKPGECESNLRFVDICASYLCDLSVAQCESGEIYMWGKTSTGKIITEPTDSQCDSIHQVFAFFSSPNVMPKPMRHTLQAKRRIASTVLKTLESEFGNPDNSDLTILVDNREIYVHQAILKMRSTYLRSMLSRWLKDNERVITIEEKSFAAIEAYLKYLYTDELKVNLEVAAELLLLADEYNDENFKLLCEQSIKRDLTADEVAYLLAFTRKLETYKDLNKFCLNYALKHAEKVIQSKGFEKWDLDAMKVFTVELVKIKKADNHSYLF